MKKIFKISKNFKEAEEWDIIQNISMTIQERVNAARSLEVSFYGKNVPDVRERKFFNCIKVDFQKT